MAQCKTGVYDCTFINNTGCTSYNEAYPLPPKLKWVVYASGFVGSVMAFGIGANDAANSWGTSVGSNAISMRNAVVLGGIFEWIGAVTMGYGVSSTIMTGISPIDSPNCWACGYCDSKISLYMVGMFSALVGAAIFLLLASYTAVPVSTSHAIIGGVVGITLVGTHWDCLDWGFDQLAGILTTWVTSPLLAGVVSIISLTISERCIRFSNTGAQRRALNALPFLYAMVSWIILTLVVLKNSTKFGKISNMTSVLISSILAVLIGLVAEVATSRWMNRDRKPSRRQGEKQAIVCRELGRVKYSEPSEASPAQTKEPVKNEESAAINVFKQLLVFSACCKSYVHGANDTANSTGAFSAVIAAFEKSNSDCVYDGSPSWVMIAAGGFVFLGMVSFGSRVIRTLGEGLAVIDFHRGFHMEFGSTMSVVIATVLNFPVSTTHCQVGAVFFTSLWKLGRKQVNWGMLGKIGLSWLVTLPLAGGIAIVLMAIIVSQIQ